jgi:hypothetical protein
MCLHLIRPWASGVLKHEAASYSDNHRWWSTEQRRSIRTNAGDEPARTNIGHSDKFRWWASLRGALLFGQIPVNPGRRGRNGVFGQIPVWTRRGEPATYSDKYRCLPAAWTSRPIRTNTGAGPSMGAVAVSIAAVASSAGREAIPVRRSRLPRPRPRLRLRLRSAEAAWCRCRACPAGRVETETPSPLPGGRPA